MIGEVMVDMSLNGEKPFTIKMNDIRAMNVMAGANGVGKSFIMMWMWWVSFIMQLHKINLNFKLNTDDNEFKELIEETLPLTFDGGETATGFISIQDPKQEVYRLDIQLEGGKVKFFNLDIKEAAAFSAGSIEQVSYNSKSARTFDQFETYIKTLGLLNLGQPISMNDFQKVGTMYKLYDIMWFEKIRKHTMDWKQYGIPAQIHEQFINLCEILDLGDSPRLIFIDDFIGLETSKYKKKFASLSAGQQAYLMLGLFAGGR